MSGLSKDMSCWISGDVPGAENLEFCTRPVPEAKSDTVVIQVKAAALNFSDLLMIDGTYQVRPPRPFVPGQEVAGIVIATGENCRWKVGDRIASKVFWGGFAEYVEVREDMAIPIPDNMGFAQAVALPVAYMTAMVALHHSVSVGPQDRVLVHAAAGGVGLAAVEIAHAAGAQVIGTAGSAEKRALAKQHGADHTVDYREPNWKDQVKELTGDKGATIIVDPVGGDVALQSLRCIARYGTLLIVGFASGEIAKLPSNYLLLKSARAQGVLWSHDQDTEMVVHMTDRLGKLLDSGMINPVVCDNYTLSDLPKALKDLGNRGTMGKVVLTVSGGE
ncbi:NADPH:quinone oxidoreductase family protein [Parasedimentitalea huanghaiensis]|uniref:Zinc-binding dehydrogenase n=1 Tax=Parasedimentitalea huanghaiensis TaxID=2682100 RepID=A0A6L6WHL6_9RHOB|nr:NADPH:quinone oxidoreductase family protein [Zongyanglinia huanghaiensis]MVO17343.1 zinc-binding dehydrogenase [Zongyanglinia huanghaiensis]